MVHILFAWKSVEEYHKLWLNVGYPPPPPKKDTKEKLVAGKEQNNYTVFWECPWFVMVFVILSILNKHDCEATCVRVRKENRVSFLWTRT